MMSSCAERPGEELRAAKQRKGRGPSDDKFEFSLDVQNDSEDDAAFNFKAVAPPGWEISFKPAYEEKQISSLQIKANESKTVNVVASPPYNASTGDYPFTVTVQSPKARSQVDLQVVLTGTYKLSVTGYGESEIFDVVNADLYSGLYDNSV